MRFKRLIVAVLSLMMAASGIAAFAAFAQDSAEPLYQMYFQEDGSFAGINVKTPMEAAVYMGIRQDMTVMNNVFAMQTVDFGTPIDTAESTGLFIKMKGPARKLGFPPSF